MTNTTLVSNLYPIANGTSSSNAFVDVFLPRDPTSNDVFYPVQKKWLNTTNEDYWILAGFSSAGGVVQANWIKLGGGVVVEQFTVDASTPPGTNPVLPSAGNVTITGGQVAAGTTANVIQTDSLAANTYTIQVQRSQAVASSTVGDNGVCHFNSEHFTVDSNGFVSNASSSYPITPYVVGPVGQAGYQTIQAGINAAHAAGGGMVFVQFGTYTENLTFYTNIQLFGDSESGTTIIGTHTPPTSGILNINRVTFQSATNVFSSAAAGTAQILVEDTTFNVTNGYSFNLANWTGQIQCFNIGNFGTNDGGINNTGGAQVFLFSAGLGNGTSNPMILSGLTIMQGPTIDAPVHFVTGSTVAIDNGVFGAGLSFLNNSTGYVQGSDIVSGAAAAITMSSSGAVGLYSNTINSSNNPAIAGAGAGTLSVGNLTFVSNTAFANTLTLSGVGGYVPGAFGTIAQVLTSNGSGVVPTFQNLSNTATWTPALKFGGSTTGITYSVQSGEYTQIGNTVFYGFVITLTSKGAQTGTATITGLPINATSATHCCLSFNQNLTYTGFNTIDMQITGTPTTITLIASQSGGAISVLADTAFANTTTIAGNGFYFTS